MSAMRREEASVTDRDGDSETGLYFQERPRPGARDPFRSSFGEESIVVASVKAWCPEDGGHDFESEDVNVFSSWGSALIEVQCPIHGWKDATF